MQEKKSPFQQMIFVCTNVREDGRLACANPGRKGKEICEKLKQYVKESGLIKRIRVARSGCMDLCAHGPNVIIWPKNNWYAGVQESNIQEIIKKEIDPLLNG